MSPDRRITLVTAIATFLGLTAVSVVVWALTRPDVPAVAATASASALPVSQPAEGSGTFERISVDELKALADAGNVVVIDVRSADQFMGAHIPGALHIPVASIEGEIQYLPKKPVVTYCTCPSEESSGEAALILQKHGVPAKALLGGLGAWTAAGYPTLAGVK